MATNRPHGPMKSSSYRRNDHKHPNGSKIRLFHSPRIDAPDHTLFPSAKDEQLLTSSNSLDRWNYMAKLAGRHQQPHDRLHVNLQRVASAPALAAGVPVSIGENIQTLYLPLTDASQLPEWLDAISNVFPNLLHLHFSNTMEQSPNHADSSHPIHTISSHNATTLSDETLVRRLYVLYRLPRLESMDGQAFSSQEKKLSRPRDRSPQPQQPETPNDANVSCLLDESSDEEDVQIAHNREVEIGLNGKPMPCDPDRWEYASVESSAVACEWGCGISSLPYFQRNTTISKSKKKKAQKKSKKRTTPPQTAMRLNQFTFEDSIEIDDSTSSEVCRISTPPSETLVLESSESPISSSSSHSKSPQSNQENVAAPPPTRSLTSPFPMQFRSARCVTERVDKLIGVISEESGITSPEVSPRDTIDQHRASVPLTRIQSSPSNLGSKPTTNRPPPCPGRRAPLGTRPQRTKRRQNRWRERLTARSNSIFDEDDEDDDDEDDEDQEEQSDSSDEQDAVVKLEPTGLRLT